MELVEPKSRPGTWIFGYGSLIWRPDFEYDRKETALLRGYGRYFWQGSWSSRGTKEQPGRVATITEEEDAEVWGVAFRVSRKAMEKTKTRLAKRETGYDLMRCDVSTLSGEVICAEVYIARQRNEQYMGPTRTLQHTANDILQARGKSGSCVDYLIGLVTALRHHVPANRNPCDGHLVQLEGAVRWRLDTLALHSDRLLTTSQVDVQKGKQELGVEAED
ncbi:putative glutathione-specific gamma-glutamylcyclotransferase 2 [Sycon ciliatum]|uniref:putative glutathione-specific gamma-glutamylcyclotransferase 2 n=1 Tax=Sycon ciliatum TaxID=27933 RepID=UPI0031F676C2